MPIPLSLYQQISPRRVKAAKQHLDLAFGDTLSKTRKEEIISNSLVHFLTLPVHSFITSTWSNYEIHESLTISEESISNLKEALAEDKGLFFLTCHLGHFEFAMRYVSDVLPHNFSILTKKFSPAWLNNIIQNKRKRHAHVIYKIGAAKNIMRTLKNKGAVAILMDQNRPDGIFVPFFNRLAGTSPLAATLSAKLGTPILPACCVRNAEGKHEIIINKAFTVAGYGDKTSNIEEGTRRCNAEMENFILQYPDQYLWTHMRYKACAEGQEPLYKK